LTAFGKFWGSEATFSTGYCPFVPGVSLEPECCSDFQYCKETTRINERTKSNANLAGLLLEFSTDILAFLMS
jgi:hypothetical protein